MVTHYCSLTEQYNYISSVHYRIGIALVQIQDGEEFNSLHPKCACALMTTNHKHFWGKMASFSTPGVYKCGSQKRGAFGFASGFSLIVLL